MILANKTPIWFLLTTASKDMFYTTLFTIILFLIHLKYTFFAMPIGISAILGTTIALILSFRLAQSYDRWWEARKIWGAIVNDSRSLSLQVLNFSAVEEHQKAIEIVNLQVAWVSALSHQLRHEPVDKNYIQKYIAKEHQDEILLSVHPALMINNLINQKIESIESIDQFKRMQLDSTLVRLVASMGASERIKNTVFPGEYQLYLRFSIYIFLAFMSISLENLGHTWEVLLILFIATPFFLLEKAAQHLQDPFEGKPTDVPISTISRNIEINLLTLLKEKEVPTPLEATGFYIN